MTTVTAAIKGKGERQEKDRKEQKKDGKVKGKKWGSRYEEKRF